jgi:hypothetical protein
MYAARARIAYWSRHDVGDPEKASAARREFAILKLESCIRETLELTGPLTADEHDRIVGALLPVAA